MLLAWADVTGRCCWQNGATPEIERIVTLLDQVRAFAQRCARDAATFIHQQLADIADIKHEPRVRTKPGGPQPVAMQRGVTPRIVRPASKKAIPNAAMA